MGQAQGVDMIRRYTLSNRHKIGQMVDLLHRELGINSFWRYTLNERGEFTVIGNGNNPDWCEEYFDQQYYLDTAIYRHPQYFEQGWYFPRLERNKSWQEFLNTKAQKVDEDNDVVYIDKCGQEIKGWMFSSCAEDSNLTMTCVNNFELLKLFTRHFEQEMASQIASMNQNKINMADMKGAKFF